MGQDSTSVRNQLEDLDLVESTLSMGGGPIPFAYLTLEQKFNAHHVMQVRVNYEAISKPFMGKPEDVINLIGEKISLTMYHRVKKTYNIFLGLITNAVIEGTLGTDNNVLITAKSTSIRLDGKKSMDSFDNTQLSAVVNDALGKSGNNEEMIIDPTFKEKIDYICQYNETDFEFFNRLSYIYGEWFWNDGEKTHFGRGKLSADKGVEMTYDVDMLDFRLKSNLTPARFNRYNYLIHEDEEIKEIAPDKVPGQRNYLDITVGKSDGVFQAEGDLPSEAPVLSRPELENLVRIERSRAVGETLTVEGTSRTCEVKIGKPITLRMPYEDLSVKVVEEFLVTGVTHYIDELGHYSNYFTGIINGLEAIPMAPVVPPLAYQQQAEVMDNADPKNKGRVRVQLQWQKNRGKCTNWIRVATPDAGSSDKVSKNRGFVTIPEVHDQVMIGFEYGDPNRPYVMSSIFTEKAGAGGSETNKIKSITSRSGNAMVLNDDAGSVLINDKYGSDGKIKLDGKGNINTSAKSSVNTIVGDVTEENPDGSSYLKMDKDGNIDLSSISNIRISIKGGTYIEMSEGQIVMNASNIVVMGNTSIIGNTIDMMAVQQSFEDESAANEDNHVCIISNKVDVQSFENVNIAAQQEVNVQGASNVNIN